MKQLKLTSFFTPAKRMREEPAAAPAAGPSTVPKEELPADPPTLTNCTLPMAAPAKSLQWTQRVDDDDDDDMMLGDLLRSAGKKPSGSAAVKKPCGAKASLQQTYLDFGQKGIAHMTCAHCGLLFTTTEEDLAIHRRVCAAAASAPKRGGGRKGHRKNPLLHKAHTAMRGLDETIAALRGSGRAQIKSMPKAFKHGAAMSARYHILVLPLGDAERDVREVTDLLRLFKADAVLASTGAAGYVCVMLVEANGSRCAAAAIGRSERRVQEPMVLVTPVTYADGVVRAVNATRQTTTEVDVDCLYVCPASAAALSQRDEELVSDLRRAPTVAAFFGGTSAAGGEEGGEEDRCVDALEAVLLFLGKEVGPYGSPSPLHRMSLEAKLLHTVHVEPVLATRVLRRLYDTLDEGPYSHDLDEEARAYDSDSSQAGPRSDSGGCEVEDEGADQMDIDVAPSKWGAMDEMTAGGTRLTSKSDEASTSDAGHLLDGLI